MNAQMLSPSDREFLEDFEFAPERVWDDDPALADAAVGRVMLLGDIHNKRQVLDAALRTAADEDCDVLVQVGDFWLQDSNWERLLTPRTCAAHVFRGARRNACGGHRRQPRSLALLCHAFLEPRRHRRSPSRGPAAAPGRLPVVGRPRQHLDLVRHRRFGALGGTVSPDKWQPHVAPWRWSAGDDHPTRLGPVHTERGAAGWMY